MNAEKLAKLQALQASVRVGGKGTPRRKVKKVVHKSSEADSKKIQQALRKFNSQPIPGIEEVNMFKDDGKVIHFTNPTVEAAVTSNTFCITGNGEEKDMADLVPGILSQLGPDSLNELRRLAEHYQGSAKTASQDDNDIPDLVENFEEASVSAS